MVSSQRIGIAVVGCGYVADSYGFCLSLHRDRIDFVGAFDRVAERHASFQQAWGGRTYANLDELLADPAVSIVVNLTDPENHAGVTERAIAAGRHVYSEKPLGLTVAEARHLRDLAAARGVRLAGAPSNVLGEQAQTLLKAVREKRAGTIRLVYAEIDDGLIHKAPHRTWRSRTGKPWDARGEFSVGCTYEHAGYVVTLLVAMFGPVRRVTAFSSLLVPDKGVGLAPHDNAPDFSTGCLEFDGGVVARVTNSIVAPYDHGVTLVGDEGVLTLDDPWDFASPVRLKRTSDTRLSRLIERRLPWVRGRRIAPPRPVPFRTGRSNPTMDFMRGVRELADAIAEDRPCRMSPDLAVHITEVTEMLQYPERFERPAIVSSSIGPIAPMPWAA